MTTTPCTAKGQKDEVYLTTRKQGHYVSAIRENNKTNASHHSNAPQKGQYSTYTTYWYAQKRQEQHTQRVGNVVETHENPTNTSTPSKRTPPVLTSRIGYRCDRALIALVTRTDESRCHNGPRKQQSVPLLRGTRKTRTLGSVFLRNVGQVLVPHLWVPQLSYPTAVYCTYTTVRGMAALVLVRNTRTSAAHIIACQYYSARS